MAYSKKTTGARTQSVQNFAIDAGGVFINYGLGGERQVGATRGGSSFTVEQELREMEIDGLKNPAKGARRLVSANASLAINNLEMSVENLLIMFPAAAQAAVDLGATGGTTHQKITRNRNIQLADYITNVAIVQEVLGKTQRMIYLVKNAINTENFEVSTSPDDEVVVACTFGAHIDLSTLDDTGNAEEAWEVYIPAA